MIHGGSRKKVLPPFVILIFIGSSIIIHFGGTLLVWNPHRCVYIYVDIYNYIYMYISIYHIYQHQHVSQVCWFRLRIHPTEKKPPQHRHHLAWQVSWLSHLCEQVDSVSTGKAGRNIEKHQKRFNMSRKSWGSLCGQIMELFLHDDRGKSWKTWDFRSHHGEHVLE